MVGWAAVTGDVSLASIALFLIIFVWTPPHFWALSLYRCEDYARVGVPMLPVVAGAEKTRQHILGYAFALLAVSLLPWGLGLARRSMASPRSRSARAFSVTPSASGAIAASARPAAPSASRSSICSRCSSRWSRTRRWASLAGTQVSAGATDKRRNKNLAIALILAALAALFYLITIVKLSGNVA